MHELSIAQEVLRLTVGSAQQHGGARVLGVRVRVGQLAQVVADSLVFAFQAISVDTLADGAKMEVVETPLHWLCRSCGKRSEDPVTECPSCHSEDIDRQGTHEIVLESIEIEDAEAEVAHG